MSISSEAYSTDHLNISGTIAEVVIWTCIEPSVALICSCLPTLRPLLREIWVQARQIKTSVHSMAVSTWTDNQYELESDQGHNSQQVERSQHKKWVQDLSFDGDGNGSREAANTTTVEAPATDLDDIMLMGINVQRDIHVERAPV